MRDMECQHCAVEVYLGASGEYFHSDTRDERCYGYITTAKPAPTKATERQKLGCPKCGNFELVVAAIVYEPIEFYDDGNYEMNEGIIDYGDATTVTCNGCGWSMGNTPSPMNPKEFFEKHAAMIREEFLKEMSS